MQMKMFLTRLGEGSRMVITGDRTQIDLPRGVPSGLSDAERLLDQIPGIAFNYFTSKDVVRLPLVAKIIEAYENDAQQA
jgi:phosphate starvation-inducible PhoH-like protein